MSGPVTEPALMPEPSREGPRARPADSPLEDGDFGEVPPWRVLLDPRGRINRRGWWIWGLALPLGLGLLLHALLGIARVSAQTAEHVVNVVLLWPTLAVSIKRWHDRDKSGWWVLIVLIPVVGWLAAIVANGCLPGTRGPNRFGPEPR